MRVKADSGLKHEWSYEDAVSKDIRLSITNCPVPPDNLARCMLIIPRGAVSRPIKDILACSRNPNEESIKQMIRADLLYKLHGQHANARLFGQCHHLREIRLRFNIIRLQVVERLWHLLIPSCGQSACIRRF
ncbi:hypothetical protein PTI98_000087 [Pleurotus ostreatus]|nr:hypothetical protein PTI98_000087 [Pleurotus ostreatus]